MKMYPIKKALPNGKAFFIYYCIYYLMSNFINASGVLTFNT